MMKSQLLSRPLKYVANVGFKLGVRGFVLSTYVGKQTYSKRAIRALWKASH